MGKYIWGSHGDIKARENSNGDWIVFDDLTGDSRSHSSKEYSSALGSGSAFALWLVIFILSTLTVIGLLTVGWFIICLLA